MQRTTPSSGAQQEARQTVSRSYVVTTIVTTEEDLPTTEVARLVDEVLRPIGGEVAYASKTGPQGEQLDIIELLGGKVVTRAVA